MSTTRDTPANMSTLRGGRGGERGRGARGGTTNNATRGGAGRGRGNGAPASNNTERPSQQVYQRGGARGGARGARGNTTNNRGGLITRQNSRSRGNSPNVDVSSSHPTGGPNSTPFAQDDYPKRLEYIRAARPLLRERFIQDGRMNPEGQMRLADSVKLYGICTDMCPEYERLRRVVEDDVKPPECTPETEHLPRKQRIADESRMVKAYARSAAGMDVELVSEIRSPATCLKTIDYLMERLDHDDFDFLHSWVWDRTRAIRKDLRTQRIEQRSEINILLTTLERSARFYLLSTHQMARTKKIDYSHQQDIEQLNQTFMSLKERYADNRRIGYPSENEAEFWAYRLILAPLFHGSQYENELHGLPPDLRNNPRVQVALEIYRAMKSVIFSKSTSFIQAQANWKHFWEIVKSPSVSYLMACACEVSFQRVRHVILDALWRVYRMGSVKKPRTVDTWTMDKVKDVLGLDTEAEAFELCVIYGFTFGQLENDQHFLDVCAKGYERKTLDLPANMSQQDFSQAIVETKRYGRAFSAVIRAMSVQAAKKHGLMIDSSAGGQIMEDETSLFVPEAPIAKPSVFSQTTTTPKSTPIAPSVSAPLTNPFIKNAAPAFQAFPGLGSNNTRSGVFDSAKNEIKFVPSGPSNNPFGNIQNPTISTPTAPAAQVVPSPSTNGASGTGFNFFAEAAKAKASLPAAATPAPASNLFGVSGLSTGVSQPQSSLPTPSFTPVGSPAPLPATTQDEEKRKAEEEQRRRKAEAEAQAQQQRLREEQARQAREAVERQQAAERQRLEAERERQRREQEERARLVREAQERQRREEEAQNAKLQARETAWNSLTTDLIWDNEEGLMLQFIENLVVNTAEEVVAAEDEKRRQVLEEKRMALLKAIYEARQLAFKRSVMATWIAKVEKRKRARQAKDRRRRLKEQKARTMNEEADENVPPAEHEATTGRTKPAVGFHKPQAPASARRAKRTEERRSAHVAQQNGVTTSLSQLGSSEQHAPVQAVLTPISMSNSLDSSVGYSEAYQKSTAPIDRTETDYFILRAQGLDPSKHRKRSFDSSSGEEEQLAIEPKRPKLTPSDPERPSLPPPATIEHAEARLRAIQQRRLEKSVGSHLPASNNASQSPPSSRATSLAQKARELLGKSTSSKPSLSVIEHDYGRSVPNLGLSASSTARRSLLGKSIGTAATMDRPAFYARKSRFVPQHLYGQGGEAARAYRQQLNSPPGTRPTSTEPLAVSSSIPTRVSYMPPNGYTQEQYSEEEEDEFSGVEQIDADAFEEDAAMSEEEYEGDEETEEEDEHQAPLNRRQFYQNQHEDEDGDSPMSGDDVVDVHYNNGFTNGHHVQHEEEEEFEEEYTDEAGDMEDDTESQNGQSGQPAQTGKKAPSPKKGGNTEDDAIELSD
ncbi:hypothetical protein EK21DRAFT_63256 [Setomelanomma holmii]|uniref:SAC3/GANP/THP3 conserved domain-containing protein n=1 Tax=Setomelanomma holmii TaxID=210430 RepID=A0A9P4LMW9_9PLEO|nr:hypothetical protein EK21DRAFT_63256 [Setomelanomma holmii]